MINTQTIIEIINSHINLDNFIETTPMLNDFPEGLAFYEVSFPGIDFCDDVLARVSKTIIDGGSAIQRKLKLLDCNSACVEQSGYYKEELKNHSDIHVLWNCPLLIKEEDIEAHYKNIVQRRLYQGVFQWKRPDKKPNWIKYSALPISNAEKNYVLILYFNITPQILAQNKLKQFCTSQAKAIHDFKSPSVGIISWAKELMISPDLTCKGLTHIYRSAHRLLDLAEAGLSMNEIFSGQIELKSTWVLLEDIEATLDSIYALEVARKGLSWAVDFPIEKLQIYTDELRLTQILQNLVNNAIKFTKKGQIKVYCQLLGGPDSTKGIEITISDTGIGIAPENQDKIFEPYFILGLSTEGEIGHGLGLTTTKELIESMNGIITLTSVLNQGTIFTISFPQMEYRVVEPLSKNDVTLCESSKQ